MTIFFRWLSVRAWVEHRPGGLLLIPIIACLQFIPISILVIRRPRVLPTAGYSTALKVYALISNWSGIWRHNYGVPLARWMPGGAIGAVDLCTQAPVFHVWDAAEFGLAYVYKKRQIEQALQMIEAWNTMSKVLVQIGL
jgi:hypothetical protein